MGQFIGIGPIEKVWGIHKPTGLLAPVGENGDGHGLFDVPVRNVKFGPHGEELIVTPRNYAGAQTLSCMPSMSSATTLNRSPRCFPRVDSAL